MTASDSPSALETLRPPANSRGKHVSWVLAVAMHVALAALLIYGIQWQTKPPDTVSVELVRALPPIDTVAPAPTEPAKVEPAPEPVLEPPPKAIPEPPPPITKPAPAKPAPIPVKPDIAVKQKEKPKPPVEKIKPAAEKPVPVAVPPPPDPFARQLEEEAKRINKQKVANQAQQELESLRQAQAVNARKKLTDAWISQIQAKVRGNIVLPSQVKGNPEAVFEVTQLPGGEIIEVRLKQSCGIAVLDSAIERAIRKSSPLPKPDRPDLFERVLELRVRPVDKE
ncbi:MAG: cell envelope integrity protein TolA [Rhodocyclaceae bacterium]|nr:cell envelope integrity protein TolA [Rhodocyclaceae bacterium]